MRILLAACLLALPMTVAAQSAPEQAFKSFTSPDGTFRITYPGLLIHCERQPQESGDGYYWSPEACSAYIPACSNVDGPDQPIVCLAYPRNKYSDSPTFDAAVFSVWVGNESEKECLADSERPVKPIVIRGVKFKGGESADAAMSHARNAKVYSAFHNGKCYGLGITVVTTNAGVFEAPVKELTKQDWAEINHRLEQARDSFEFLK